MEGHTQADRAAAADGVLNKVSTIANVIHHDHHGEIRNANRVVILIAECARHRHGAAVFDSEVEDVAPSNLIVAMNVNCLHLDTVWESGYTSGRRSFDELALLRAGRIFGEELDAVASIHRLILFHQFLISHEFILHVELEVVPHWPLWQV